MMGKKSSLPVTRWVFPYENRTLVEEISKEFGILPEIAQILVNRGIRDTDAAKRYLSPSLRDLHSPFLMKDMGKGARRVIRALHNNEKITIFGDYDADGITATVILLKFLHNVTSNVDYYIPDRIEEGYGLNKKAIDRIKYTGTSLIITVDCGISDTENVEYAKSKGMDVIILDHHEIPPKVPKALAVINPNQRDCSFAFRYLTGVGVAFNFLIALRALMRQEGFWGRFTYPNLKEYLDLVALGTLGDIAPLIDENRIMTKIGLDLITEDSRVGIKALKEVSGLANQVIDANKATFCLIPRINAAGRVGSPQDAVRLLLTEDLEEAREIARRLETYNRKRQTLERAILQDILKEIEQDFDLEGRRFLVFSSKNWHPGVIGVVASRLVDRYRRPVMLISLQDGIGRGSGRSVNDFNIYESLRECDHLLLSYGGHQLAAGICIREEDIENFSRTLEEIVGKRLGEGNFIRCTHIDAHCELSNLSHELLSQVALLAPYGNQNPEPVFYSRNVSVLFSSVVGNNHLRMRVVGSGITCNSIWYSMGHLAGYIKNVSSDIAFTPQINFWNGMSEIQLKMLDMAIQENISL
ncbi:MAG: single-stranded-DNA-specific exonuclease RecJ [Syntrophales bacterium]|nr:single-stranded-DNA-specific exonuclease RecJ [Syntrophales bacterium]